MPWTETARREYRRRPARYASDLTEGEWELIAPFLPPPKPVGRPRTTDLREVVDPVYRDDRLSVGATAEGLSAAVDGAALFLRLAR